ncbi:hypothetical protein BBP00_00009189 [Phytophthora kernoviae]|uniref:Nucleotide-diphospho-sugar transferase n=1 Tax=Phytophthora kernoviae TaxID=325452 RepID=A0A3F2RDC4_9STRA|nr:hypothetical protein BBP00_00009189 [Phytophthora kernoviae]
MQHNKMFAFFFLIVMTCALGLICVASLIQQRDLQLQRLAVRSLHGTNDRADGGGLRGQMTELMQQPADDAVDDNDSGIAARWRQLGNDLNAYECVGWRAQRDCSPEGGSDPQNDRLCNATIHNGESGYCEIRHKDTGVTRRVMQMHCDSLRPDVAFRCDEFVSLLEQQLVDDQIRAAATVLEKHKNNDDKVDMSMGCTLPVELWYMRSETDPSHPILRELTGKYDVFMREILDPRAKKFYTKTYAVFYSAFDQVLLLDADNFAVRDPTYLFETPEFKNTGAIFWPDFWRPKKTIFNIQPTSFVWDVFDLDAVDMFEQESGQVLIDRSVHQKALNVLMYYAFNPGTFERLRLAWGDKDLFRFAWLKTKSSFHMIKTPPGSAGLKLPDVNIFCGVTMVQHDPDRGIVFLHRNQEKLTSENREKVWSHIQDFRVDKVPMEDYDVRGANGGRYFPQFKRCYGKDIYYEKAFTVTAMEELPFAGLEQQLLDLVQEAARIDVLLLLALSASCGWYSQHIISLSYEGNDVQGATHDVIVRRQHLLAKITAYTGGSGSSAAAKIVLSSVDYLTDGSSSLDGGADTIINPMDDGQEEKLDGKLNENEKKSQANPKETKPPTSKPTQKPTQKLGTAPEKNSETSKSPSRAPVEKSQSVEDPWAPIKSVAELDMYECKAWRQTANCSPRGESKPKRDASCDKIILPSDSGFCEYRHRKTGAIRRIVGAKCKSRASQMGYSCANATMLVRYNLLADGYKPLYPMSFENNQRDFLQQNDLSTTKSDKAVVVSGAKMEKPKSFSRGIAYVVYEQLLLSVYAAIRALRSTGCKLPIELWYREEETNTSHPLLQELTGKYGAYLRVIQDSRAIKFYTKLYAVFYSAFDNLLLLDADNFAARDPTYLFATEVYNDTGAVFWPDFWMPNRTIFKTKKNSDVWELMGVPYIDMFEQESGQVLVNRAKHTKALHAMLHYALTEPHLPAEFNMLWGDKDLFRFAWMRTNSNFHMISRPAGSAGLKAPNLNIFCGSTMVQHDPKGDIVFLHRNIVKFLPDGNNTEKFWHYVQQYNKDQDLRFYEVRGDVDHRWFPNIRKCYGKRINYLRAYSLKPITDFPFAGLEDEIISHVVEGEKLIKDAKWVPTPTAPPMTKPPKKHINTDSRKTK